MINLGPLAVDFEFEMGGGYSSLQSAEPVPAAFSSAPRWPSRTRISVSASPLPGLSQFRLFAVAFPLLERVVAQATDVGGVRRPGAAPRE